MKKYPKKRVILGFQCRIPPRTSKFCHNKHSCRENFTFLAQSDFQFFLFYFKNSFPYAHNNYVHFD